MHLWLTLAKVSVELNLSHGYTSQAIQAAFTLSFVCSLFTSEDLYTQMSCFLFASTSAVFCAVIVSKYAKRFLSSVLLDDCPVLKDIFISFTITEWFLA